MPYELKKIKNYYKVINKNDGLELAALTLRGKVKAKHTTREKGKKMIRLLDYIDSKKYKKR